MPHPTKKKTREQQLREAVNTTGVEIVKAGFDAIDEIAELGKQKLKKTILEMLTGRKVRR
jgi:hypothetical protein